MSESPNIIPNEKKRIDDWIEVLFSNNLVLANPYRDADFTPKEIAESIEAIEKVSREIIEHGIQPSGTLESELRQVLQNAVKRGIADKLLVTRSLIAKD